MKTRAYFISTTISTILQCLYILVVTLIGSLLLPNLLQSITIDPSSGPPAGFSNFMWVSTAISGIGFVLAPIVYVGSGALYAWLHRREAQPVTAEQGAVGGAAVAATARFTTGLFQALTSLLVTGLLYQNIASQIGPIPGGIPGGTPFIIGFGIFSGVMGSILGTCFGSVFAAALGALGGSLTGALLK